MSEAPAASMQGATGPRPSWRSVLPFIVGLSSFALLAALNQARGFDLWRNYALSGVGMGGIVTWVLWRYDVRVPHYIQWVIVSGLLLHYGGGSLGSPSPYAMGLLGFHGINGAYHTFDWWDHLTHGVGIGAGTMACAYLLEVYQVRRGLAWRASAVWLLALLSGLAAGVGVELYEYLGKAAFQTIDQGGYVNTMLDLHYNVLGALVGGTVAAVLDRRRHGRRIERQWGRQAPDHSLAPWPQRIPPAMSGFIAFVAMPAAMTLVLATRFFLQDAPTDDPQAYEDALQSMLASAILGVVAGPLVAVWRRMRTRPREATA